MSQLDLSQISLILPGISTIVAIVAPVITSIWTIKSQEKMKKLEMYSPRVYDALAELSRTYSKLNRGNNAPNDDESQMALYMAAQSHYYEFMASCYKVMSLVPGAEIHEHISVLLTDIRQFAYSPNRVHDDQFSQLVSEINEYILTLKIKKPRRSAKNRIKKGDIRYCNKH